MRVHSFWSLRSQQHTRAPFTRNNTTFISTLVSPRNFPMVGMYETLWSSSRWEHNP